MNERDQPDNGEGEQYRGAEVENTLEIFSERHGRERDRSGETDGSGNKAGHKADRGVINFREKVIFAAGARECGAQLAVGKGAAQRRDPTDHPQQQQRETGMNFL